MKGGCGGDLEGWDLFFSLFLEVALREGQIEEDPFMVTKSQSRGLLDFLTLRLLDFPLF